MFGTQAKIDDKQNMDDMRTGTVLLCSADNIHNIYYSQAGSIIPVKSGSYEAKKAVGTWHQAAQSAVGHPWEIS